MAEREAASPKYEAPVAKPAASTAVEAPKGNPVFRMMGLPNIKMKIPSRNWLIFWTIVGSWTGAVVYDRQQKKRIQRKWCNVVADLAKQPLPPTGLPRKLSIFLAAPPADGLIPARDHFNEFIKPILNAAALDWDAVEGRREGDIRAGLAERIRKLRKQKGEYTNEPLMDDDLAALLDAIRERGGVTRHEAVEGDIVIGRHAWKEYIRGLHEGWLGPIDPPSSPPEPTIETVVTSSTETSDEAPTTAANADETHTGSPLSNLPAEEAKSSPDEAKEKEEEAQKKEEELKSKKKKQPPPTNQTSDYPTSHLSPVCPNEFQPSVAIQLPHLLGFLNTPIRMWRFLNKRAVADDVGRQAAAAVFAVYRPYESPSHTQHFSGASASSNPPHQTNEVESGSWEQAVLLKREEADWHKSVRQEAKEDPEFNKEGRERIWTRPMVLDERIADRMRKFELNEELERRAREVEKNLRPWYFFGFAEKKPDETEE
ncbi:hypothetical protein EJ05DRAFT_507208 [Pseudovirgaria hyperparasitica]|uniref:Mitochondrial import inner membrane translocase subunit TIM54 n=1 Tax=Pseudovirgaria hyperparasitica TaxID=470096 RepID=A0A6A6WHJ7_9PEZI|nr:uncharacterized protein EJ05DRAFT_507208 [Pseudovirgaria hyperparasitica]KAF2761550.1 hypothetical protein EJ05DRAFT_507208 [Pseudovirgaria hyperparasitica]